MNKVVLITGIGGDVAQGIATILQDSRPDLYLVGTDVHFRHGGELFVDAFEVVPKADSTEYISTIQSLIKKYSVSIFIPNSEPELRALLPCYTEFKGIKCITSGRQVVEIGLDKFATMQAIEQLGIPIPWTELAINSKPLGYPCILKSRYGSGSTSVLKIENEEESRFYARRFPEAIFQEMLEPWDREVTCAVYRKRDGEVSILLMLRHLNSGCTVWAKIIDDPVAVSMCSKIAEGLNLQGSMNIQLLLTQQGPRIFEINPRFSSTVLMRHKVGFADLLWAIDEAEDKTVEFPSISKNRLMVRVQKAVVIDQEDIVDKQ